MERYIQLREGILETSLKFCNSTPGGLFQTARSFMKIVRSNNHSKMDILAHIPVQVCHMNAVRNSSHDNLLIQKLVTNVTTSL